MTGLAKSWFTLLAVALIAPGGAFAGGRKLHRHDQHNDGDHADHYSDKGAHPAKSEDNNGVVVQSRALIDKQGVVELELTTGKIGSSAAPGTISDVHVRAIRADGKEALNKKFRRLNSGGYFRTTLNGLAHLQLLKMKVGVDGIPKRDDHVDIEHLQDVVRYRPDLAVQALDYSPLSRPSTNVTFTATLKERMGDLGGHADCVLLVDGKEVDRVPGVWADAASTVSCKMVHAFGSAGTYAVAVQLQNAVPGSYDVTNKSLGGQIRIENPNTVFYDANVVEQTDSNMMELDRFFSPTGTVPDEHGRSGNITVTQGRHFTFSIPTALAFPMSLSYADASSGKTLSSVSFANVPTAPPRVTTGTYTSEVTFSLFDEASWGSVDIQRCYNDTTQVGVTRFTFSWDAGAVTYISEAYCNTVPGGYQCGPDLYYPNRPPETFSNGGVMVTFGNDYTGKFWVKDNNNAELSATTNMALTPDTIVQKFPDCHPYVMPAGGTGRECITFTSTHTVKSGFDQKTQ